MKKYNTNSWHANLYKWFNGCNDRLLPQQLCPYGRTIIGIIFSLSVLWIVLLPYWVATRIFKMKKEISLGEQLHFCKIVWLLVWIIGSPFGSFFLKLHGHWGSKGGTLEPNTVLLAAICIVGDLVFVCFVCFLTSEWVNESEWVHRKISKIKTVFSFKKKPKPEKTSAMIYPRERQPSILWEFMKALHSKVCPKIEWNKKQ
jgi:hypothetical protein